MDSTSKLIHDLDNETLPDSVSPQRLASIFDSLHRKQSENYNDLSERIDGSQSHVPDDIMQRIEAIGESASRAVVASNKAQQDASAAKDSAEDAISKANEAKGAADSAQSSAQEALSGIKDIPNFWTGSVEQYNSLSSKDESTIYFITES